MLPEGLPPAEWTAEERLSLAQLLRKLVLTTYGLYAVMVFAVVASLVLIMLIPTPGLERRRRVASMGARCIFALCGIPITEHQRENLPNEPCVVVANHASYLDGVLMCALLPARFGFVIKREVTQAPFVHFLLRRIGAYFVERHDRGGSARDARALVRAAASGRSLAVFPEGTFRAEPGIRPFKAGAFAAAVNGGHPVVPVAIDGARAILPAGRWLPRRGALHVSYFKPIACTGAGRSEMRRLADRSREVILGALDELDLQPATELPQTRRAS